jgi:hypothetical protein
VCVCVCVGVHTSLPPCLPPCLPACLQQPPAQLAQVKIPERPACSTGSYQRRRL